MYFLAKLIYLAIALFIFFTSIITNVDDKHYAINNKLYLFIYFFILQFIFEVISKVMSNQPIDINSIIQTCISSSLLAVIAFDVYNDLIYNGYFLNYSENQKYAILILLILGFITVIQVLQIILTT